jgi:hypothetical protein
MQDILQSSKCDLMVEESAISLVTLLVPLLVSWNSTFPFTNPFCNSVSPYLVPLPPGDDPIAVTVIIIIITITFVSQHYRRRPAYLAWWYLLLFANVSTVWVFFAVLGPLLWSSGQSSWLRPRGPGYILGATDFLISNGPVMGSTQPREYNWRAAWKEKQRLLSRNPRLRP